MPSEEEIEMENEGLGPLAEITEDSTRASEEIEIGKETLCPLAEITEDSIRRNKSCWVIELKEELMKEEETSGRTSAVVFSVAKAFSASDQQYYIPSIISFGPHHFGRADLSSMEPHKTEAVRRMQKRIHGRCMESVVETEILAMDTSIRMFYDKELPHSAISSIDLAWMVTKDSCFLFEFMLNYLRTRNPKAAFHNDCVVEGRYDAVFSSSLMNPTMKNIIYDLALFENQIPLFVIEELLRIAYSISDSEKILGDILSRMAILSRFQVFKWGMARPYKKQKALHFLEVLYYRHIGWDLAGYSQEAYSVKDQRLLHFGWIRSIFTSCCPWWMQGRGVEGYGHSSLLKLPSVAELKKKGVKLCAVTPENSAIREKPQGIRWVQFDEKTSTFYFPELSIDLLRYALLRNFIALENTSNKFRSLPIISFAFLMDELIDSEEDVAVLREANIVSNYFGSNQEAAKYFNALTRDYRGYPAFARCKPIEDARRGLHQYLKRNYKILWSEFISTYFSKPWVVAGSVAAVLLLLMTVLQVFCLFYTCNRTT